MTRLSVNLNKVALLRNARAGGRPGPGARPRLLDAAAAVVAAGAHGLTLHPRPDRRHALPEDVVDFTSLLAEGPGKEGVELNVEGNPFHGPGPDYPGFVALCESVRPTQVTLVPDATGQLTSDHGWGPEDIEALRPLIARLRSTGSRVSLFVDPEDAAVDAAADAGADRVELYTGPWADAYATGTGTEALRTYADAAGRAVSRGMSVNAGHDLDQENLGAFLEAVPETAEVSIGQALIADALELGLGAAVAAYLEVIRRAGAPGSSPGQAHRR